MKKPVVLLSARKILGESALLRQAFGEDIRAQGGAGIVYNSVRLRGGTNMVAYLPGNVRDVVQEAHYEVTAPVAGKVVARELT